MYWIIGAIVVVVLGVGAGYWLYRRNRTERLNAPTTATPGNRWSLRPNRDLEGQVRTWVADKSGDKKLATWFAELPESEARQITREMKAFAQRNDFALGWLLQDDMVQDRKLETELRNALVQYLKARMTAAQADDSIQTFDHYQQMIQRPGAHEALVQRLYTELVQRDLAPATSPEMVMAPSAERRVYLLERIQEAANKDWKKFSEALTTVLEAQEAERAERRANRWQLPTLKLPKISTPRFLRRQGQSEAAEASTDEAPSAQDQPAAKTPDKPAAKPADAGNKGSAPGGATPATNPA